MPSISTGGRVSSDSPIDDDAATSSQDVPGAAPGLERPPGSRDQCRIDENDGLASFDELESPAASDAFSFDPGGPRGAHAPASTPMGLDELLALSFDDDPSGKPGAAPTPEVPVPVGATGQPEIERQTVVTRRPMDVISAYAPRNNAEKKQVLERLFHADAALEKAQSQFQTATAARDEAAAKLARDPAAPRLQAAASKADAALAKAELTLQTARTQTVAAEANVRALMQKQSPGRATEVPALDISARTETQTTYDVKVGGQTIKLRDDVQSYATTHRTGLDSPGVEELVGPVIAASNLSASTKNILQATSKNEGNFSAINGYDRMGASFGFIQFAGGGAGSMLSKLVQRFKDEDPAGFAASLGQAGIDVDGKPPVLVCRDHDGNELRGDAAAQFIGSDPQAAAALSASGTRMTMKTAQIELSAGVLTDARRHALPGTPIRMSDVVTSEYGNGLLFDRAVNAGPKSPQLAFDRIATAYLAQHPGADLRVDPARAAVESAFIQWAEAEAPGRAVNISKQTSHDAGSFVP
jgi:hypothetical protein